MGALAKSSLSPVSAPGKAAQSRKGVGLEAEGAQGSSPVSAFRDCSAALILSSPTCPRKLRSPAGTSEDEVKKDALAVCKERYSLKLL